MMTSIGCMRTTITLDEAVEQALREYAARRGIKFKRALNDLLQEGLRQSGRAKRAKPYRSEPKAVGLRPGLSFDNVGELLEQIEGPVFR